MKLTTAALAAVALLTLGCTATAGPAEDIIAAEKCNKCHTASTTKKGPSWASIATKYKGNAEAPAKLFKELRAGGKIGEEDDHKKVPGSDAELNAIVGIVLSSK